MTAPSWLVRTGAAWTRFWFAHTSPSTLMLLRAAYGAVMVVWAAAMLPDAALLFSEEGIAPGTGWPTAPLTWFTQTGGGAVAVVAAVAVGGAGLLIGRAPRLSALVVFIGVATLHAANAGVFNAGDRVLRTLAFVLAISPLHRTPGWGRPVPAGTTVARWPLRIPQIILTISYPSSLLHKLSGTSWLEGTSVARSFRLDDMARWAELPPEITESLLFSAPLSWATLAMQASIPVLIWIPRTRWLAATLGVAMHGGIDLVLVVGFFFLAMLLLYLAFTPPDVADRWIGRVTARRNVRSDASRSDRTVERDPAASGP